jgi:mRNA interferase RelE/StbE
VPYRIEFAPGAARDLRGLPRQVQERLRPPIDGLAMEPRPPQAVKLAGSDELYRIRAGDYRVVYAVRVEVLVVLIVRVGHRREIYRDRR